MGPSIEYDQYHLTPRDQMRAYILLRKEQIEHQLHTIGAEVNQRKEEYLSARRGYEAATRKAQELNEEYLTILDILEEDQETHDHEHTATDPRSQRHAELGEFAAQGGQPTPQNYEAVQSY
jgi:hypothetical protein